MSTILSDVVTLLKYARYLPEKGRRENWEEIVARNKAMHQRKFHDNPTVLAELELVYEQVLNRQILPSMRSLQFGGLPIESNNTRMYNCAYLPVSDAECFSESIFLLLSGCGVGYSVQRQHVALLPTLSTPLPKRRYLIADSIEGWADAVKALLNAYLAGAALPEFDYSAIRPAGSLLKTAGGRAPGPEPLRRALEACSALLASKQAGSRLSPLECHDIMCHLAECVVAGGTRRSALLVLFSADDQEMLTAKTGPWWEKNPQRARANNSVALDRETVTHEQFQQLWAAVENSKSGEPGIYFSNNLNEGVNPCCEIALKPFQYCNLCEINVNNVSSQQDLNSRVKAAAFLGTLQASYTKFTYLRPIWQITTESEALLGLGMTGIGSGKVLQYDLREAAKVALAENERVAKLIGIRPASRVTTIKPSGCSRGDTLLATSQGLLSLDELRKGDEIWQPLQLQVAVQGGAKPASKFFINGKAATKRITLASGLELESTLNHRYMVAEQGVSQWRRVDEIKLGDLLPYELNFNQTDSDPTFPFEEKIVQLDHILAWLCGIYFALGSFPEDALVSNTLQSYFDTTQISGQELRFFQHYSQSLDAFLKCKPFTLKRFIDGCYYGRSTVSLASKQLALQFLIAKRSVGYDGWIRADGNQWLVGSLVGDGLEKVVSIEDSECETFDIEVPELHAYLANSVVSHNTSSLLLGCSSGIHPWYAPHYIRRIRVSKREPFYAFFKQRCPQLIEDDLFNENDAVVSFPVSAPEGSIFRQESPMELLQRVHRFNTEWIATGHRKGDNRHNVSATISIKPEEWQAVGHWMWENRCDFNGLSVLDYDLGTYKQAPHEECSKEKIDEMLKYLEGFDLAELVEEADLTDFMGEAACSGDKCERKK